MRSFTASLGAALTVAACVLPAALAQPPQPVVVQPAPPPGTVVVQPAPPPGTVVVQPAPPPGTVVVQPAPPPGTITLPPAPALLDDRLFAMAAGAGGLAEVVSSQVALARSRDEEVRKFAQQMVTDHTQARQQLTQVVTNKGIGLPLTLDIKDQAAIGALGMSQGEAFDREYARYQVAAHIGVVQLFQAEAQHGRDPEIRGFAAQTLPKLQHHLQMARQLMGRAGGERRRGADERGGAGEAPKYRAGERGAGVEDDQGDVRRPEAGAAAPVEKPGQAPEPKDASEPEREAAGRRRDQDPGTSR